MKTSVQRVRSGGSPAVVDLTPSAAAFVEGEGDGLLNVFVPHATAGVALMETGSGSEPDLAGAIDRLLPAED
ncbi:MAG TPA: YjbQ family protein, partial [Frankiaceae bacterium]|nr:YjbQ family protein [Frankiaceae bacterium]